jgi:hypothetical protein
MIPLHDQVLHSAVVDDLPSYTSLTANWIALLLILVSLSGKANGGVTEAIWMFSSFSLFYKHPVHLSMLWMIHDWPIQASSHSQTDMVAARLNLLCLLRLRPTILQASAANCFSHGRRFAYKIHSDRGCAKSNATKSISPHSSKLMPSLANIPAS